MSQAPSAPKRSRLLLAQQIDQVCDRFETAWKAGPRPRIEDYLTHTPEPGQALLLRELVALEIAYRRRSGEQPRAEEYHARFPRLEPGWLDEIPTDSGRVSPASTPLERTASLRTADAGPEATPQPTSVRCPHCHNPIHLADTRGEEVLC